ncbi:hypothetical protein T10_11382 [Trichinella papuae]|uniref:Uncharacterized protein n=1 Tax=Trichinella papuae TaxID=268474 RepID=A0A0V1M1S6_9BILA|nr:hypothetical protein T10_11382 [Trichinella papuae]
MTLADYYFNSVNAPLIRISLLLMSDNCCSVLTSSVDTPCSTTRYFNDSSSQRPSMQIACGAPSWQRHESLGMVSLWPG